MIPIKYWKEKNLFEFLRAYAPDLRTMEDTMSRWDCISDDKEYVIELKCRRTHYPTLLIEKKKYDALIEKAGELGYKALYINSTPNGIYVWHLSDVDEPEWKIENKHPATTAFGNTRRVEKEVGYLKTEDARMFE